jgi:hypothetical protein
MQAEGMRNENVAVNRIDNNAVKEANVRTGASATMIGEARVEADYYAGEFGRPPDGGPVMSAATRLSAWRGELFESHQNSIFNARTFFQVGPVQPARRNHYGFRGSGNLDRSTFLTVSGFQRKIRGMVNGNVLVPLANERAPLATDPAIRALVARWLRAYPDELPNRPDFDPRALNRNAPQRIDDIEGNARLDRDLGYGMLSGVYQISRSFTDAFQLVAGQNPINDIHAHRAQLTWRFSPSSGWNVAAGGSFQRSRTDLQPEPNAVGPQVRVGHQAEELGPDAEFPVDRAQNSFRYGAVTGHGSGNHAFTWGGDVSRVQVNGIESYYSRGQFNFQNNFGRTGYQNLLMGTPSSYLVTLGEMNRGYRNWAANLFWADRWRVISRLQIYYGVRYGIVTAPTEVNGFEKAPYSCDCDNVSPRFSLAWQAPRRWVMRASYVTSFAEIPPVTFGQMRYNLPHARSLQIQNPNVLNPLNGVDIATGRTSPTLLHPDLRSPYAHQYNASLEQRSGAGTLRFGYIGSRSFKLLNGYTMNRADLVPGIPLALDTVDIRRADPRFYDVRTVLNAGIGYFDAAQASFDLSVHRGVRGTLTYTFAKAIDEGADFTSTAANRDVNRGRAQSQYNQLQDKKGLSNFDAPHTLLANASWDLPRVRLRGILRALLDEWQASSVALLKNGTPFTLFVGSDAPGFGNVDGGPSDRPNILDASLLGKTIPHPDAAPKMLLGRFAYIRPGEMRGNSGRNTLRKARIANWNAALGKQWLVSGQREWRAHFRAEVYNLTNTPQFDEPQRNLTSPSFGKITNTLNDGRVFQFSLRLTL